MMLITAKITEWGDPITKKLIINRTFIIELKWLLPSKTRSFR